jgi:branched-chain amino acid transport system permease protein
MSASELSVPAVGDVSVRAIAIAVIVAFALVWPVATGDYWTNVGIQIIIIALFAMSFNLLFGYVGLLSFGHSAFYGAGAYAVAFSLRGVGFLPEAGSFLPAFLIGIVGAIIAAAVIGALCVQRGGIYFALLTLAFSMMFYEIAFTWTEVTGGDNGLTIIPTQVDAVAFSFETINPVAYYYFAFVAFFVSVYIMWRVVNSPYGEMLKAIRENPERAEFSGIRVKLYQWSAFVLSGAFAGVAGSLATVQLFVVSPVELHWSTGSVPVLATLLGGPTSFFGPILGGVLFVGLETTLTQYIHHWEVAIGLILIPIVLFFPNGILGALSMESLGRLRSRLTGDSEGDER